jgi:aminoglycoside 2''-adenylyltransferase
MEKQGSINGRPVRCLSWEAIYVEFLGYASEVPKREWRSKDYRSFAIVQSHICSEIQEQFRRAHLRSIGRDSE